MKKIKVYLFLALILAALAGLGAQAPDWLWVKGAGSADYDTCNDIAVDTAGNSYVTGYFSGTAVFGPFTLTSAGQDDAFIAKLDPDGNWLWAKRGGGPGQDRGTGIDTDEYGNCYVTGIFHDTAVFGPFDRTSMGWTDIFVAKLGSDGNWVWAAAGGGPSEETSTAIVVDHAGACCVTGYFLLNTDFGSQHLTSLGTTDMFVAHIYNSSWHWAVRAGGEFNESIQDVAVDNVNYGDFYITGFFENVAVFGSTNLVSAGLKDVFVAKLTNSGQWLWASRGGGTDIDIAECIKVSNTGIIYVAGRFYGDAQFGAGIIHNYGYSDVFLAKMDASGSWIWPTQLCGYNDEVCTGLALDAAGNIYITGYFSGTVGIGNVHLTSLGDYTDVFVFAFDTWANPLWAQRGGSADGELPAGIEFDGAGNMYVAGVFFGTTAFGQYTAASNGGYDIFVAKLNRFVPIPQVNISVSGGALSWTAVAGASGYNVYVADDPYGPFTLAAYTTQNSWQDPSYPLTKRFYRITTVEP